MTTNECRNDGFFLPLLALGFCLILSLRAALPVFLLLLPLPPLDFDRAGICIPVPPPYCWAIRAQGPLPLLTLRIIVRICLICSRSWLTSCKLVPLPRAMRLLRLTLRISGFC